MDKEVKLLLKMLNGTLKAMPKFLHQTIVQYQWQQAVEGAMYFLGSIALGIFLIKSMLFLDKRSKQKKSALEDSFVFDFLFPLILVGCSVAVCLAFAQGVDHIGNAISPVTSLIHTMHTF